MPPSSSVRPLKSTGVKLDEKFFSKCLTRESSMSKVSIEDYHGGASGAVPFNWESQPGTPKVKHLETPLPPLTPPPSYYCSSPKPTKKHSKPGILYTIFPKRASKKSSLPSSPASSSSSSLPRSPWPTSYSVPSSPMRPSNSRGQHGLSNWRLSFDSRTDEIYREYEYESPVSTLCFGRRANSRPQGCYAYMTKVFFRDYIR